MKHFNGSRIQATGFTLIELLVTVTIIGILTAIAVPSYSNYVTRARIPDAISTLAKKRVDMEQYFQDNHKYTDAPACSSDTTTSKYFTFSCSAVTATTFTLQATGTGAMTGFSYTITHNNAKATTVGDGAPAGWSGNDSCWVTNKGGVC